MPSCDPQALISEASCFACVSPGFWPLLELQLLCLISQSGGGGGSGTVTSVGLTAPNIFSVSGSPVVTSGTLALALATQGANLVWAGPTSGAAATPSFRALIGLDTPADFIQDNINLEISSPFTGNHGLGGTPSRVRAVLRWTATDGDFVSGTEIETCYIMDGSLFDNQITTGVNATQIWMAITSQFSTWGNPETATPTGPGSMGIDTSKVVGKIYAWR